MEDFLTVSLVRVDAQELLDVVEELGEEALPDRGLGPLNLIVAKRYGYDARKLAAVLFRLEAAVTLIREEGSSHWSLTDPDETLLTKECLLGAAAVEPLFQVDGQPCFTRATFLATARELTKARLCPPY